MYLDTKYKILFKYLRCVSRYLYLRYSPALTESDKHVRDGNVKIDSAES